jgi:hypothetical protein
MAVLKSILIGKRPAGAYDAVKIAADHGKQITVTATGAVAAHSTVRRRFRRRPSCLRIFTEHRIDDISERELAIPATEYGMTGKGTEEGNFYTMTITSVGTYKSSNDCGFDFTGTVTEKQGSTWTAIPSVGGSHSESCYFTSGFVAAKQKMAIPSSLYLFTKQVPGKNRRKLHPRRRNRPGSRR